MEKSFVHLHVHSQYSILDGACKISDIVSKAKDYGMPAVALTDHGNMFGIKEFFNAATDAGIKPILGVEAYVAETSRFKRDSTEKRGGYHLIVLAKNHTGYKNLIKLVSLAHLEGMYYKPRMDKELLERYHEGLIVSSACLGGEIPQKILKGDIEGAKEAIAWYKEVFGDDFYLELMRHKTGDPEKDRDTYQRQEYVNKYLIEFSKEFGVKLIATNDVHFLNKEDAEAHQILICLNTGKKCDDPKRKLMYTGQEFFASPEYMWELFSDIPEALENTLEIADKVEFYNIERDPILPKFDIPEEFADDYEYLRYLTYEGAKERWGDPLPENVVERLEFELSTIKRMGFPSYFLIVWDFIRQARQMGIWVGPGRGSAAGSAVAYSLKITSIDPIKYDLLFERFLNPDRISMPDIDVDFDEDGRDDILRWVAQKYGIKRVANIITFGTMAPKMAIRDVARVMGLPYEEADKLAKMVPDKANTFKKAYEMSEELKQIREEGSEVQRKILSFAEKLEGSVRHTGIHACGVIIGRDDLDNFIPLTQTKDSPLFAATQFEGTHVEKVGLLKMDFLGLKTLSILKDAVQLVKQSKGIDVDLWNLPLDDKKTYELYSRGETIGTFQFESDGMRKFLRQLKPTNLEDLIALNALYRPGPMEYIPEFIARKHGLKKIEYDLPQMEEILASTYGITIYQEQVMLLSQKLAGFTRGMADKLRKGMGKKKKEIIDELKPKFIEGCKKNGIPEEKAMKIWKDWESFASYAFNKSHSTCYAYLAYLTAYMKANYPSEYMAAVLSRHLDDIKKVTKYIEEVKRMGIKVLGPDVNDSEVRFKVGKDGEIRFGLAAIKGVGTIAAEEIVKERKENGQYKDIYDFVERVNLQVVNKRVMESLVLAGAFDSLTKFSRAQFFASVGKDKGPTFIEELLRYGAKVQSYKSSSNSMLFGGSTISVKKPEPSEVVEPWSDIERLAREKEVVGIYLSAHPLDNDLPIIKAYSNSTLKKLHTEMSKLVDKEISVAGIVLRAERKTSRKGSPYMRFQLEDHSGSMTFMLFGDTYTKLSPMVIEGAKLLVRGKVVKRNKESEDLDFRIFDIKPLADLKIGKIAIKLPIEIIDELIMEDLERFFEIKSKKKKDLVSAEFLIYDPKTKIWVTMQSRSKGIKITQEFLDYLSGNGLAYKLYPMEMKEM